MLKKMLALGCLVAFTTAFTGCDNASKVTAEAEKAKKEAEEKMSKMKDEATKAIDLPAVQTKIDSLSTEAKANATVKLAELKKLFEEFKASTDVAKTAEIKEKLMKAFEDLKKQIGM